MTNEPGRSISSRFMGKKQNLLILLNCHHFAGWLSLWLIENFSNLFIVVSLIWQTNNFLFIDTCWRNVVDLQSWRRMGRGRNRKRPTQLLDYSCDELWCFFLCFHFLALLWFRFYYFIYMRQSYVRQFDDSTIHICNFRFSVGRQINCISPYTHTVCSTMEMLRQTF